MDENPRREQVSRTVVLVFLVLAVFGGWSAFGLTIALAAPTVLFDLVFFVSFFALSSTSILLAYAFSFKMFKLKRYQGELWRATGQGLPIGMLVTVSLFLQSLRVLSTVVVIILIAIVVALEFLMLPRRTG